MGSIKYFCCLMLISLHIDLFRQYRMKKKFLKEKQSKDVALVNLRVSEKIQIITALGILP